MTEHEKEYVLIRQKRDEVPEGTLSCPDRNLAVFHDYRHYEGLRLLPSVCDSKLIQQTLITIFFKDFPLLRWYLNNEKILEMDIDARFVNSESVHLSICKFFTDISNLLSNDIYIVDDIIREHSLVLMEFIPMKTPKVLKHIKYLDM